MPKKIENPNIPKKNVVMALAGDMPTTIYEAFNSLGINIIKIKKSKALQGAVASHADMLCHYLGNKEILITKEHPEIKDELINIGFNPIVIKKDITEKYPNDIGLNSARIGNFNICNSKHTALEILEYCDNNKIEIIDVHQGYAKCATCVVHKNALITEDKSIKLKCEQKGIDVLYIKKGYVELQGYNYGFIGGCSSLISADTLAFFGRIENHPDYDNIKSFLNNYNIMPISLSKSKLTDIGGIIPLLEENL